MAAFSRFANLFTDMKEMMDYWLEDLPLPLPNTTYRWARDSTFLSGLNLASAISLNWCATMVCVRDYIEQGLDIACLDYKDLVDRPEDAWRCIKRFCNITDDMEIPRDAYERDSQRGTFLSQGVLSASEKTAKGLYAKAKEDLPSIFHAFELQNWLIPKLCSNGKS